MSYCLFQSCPEYTDPTVESKDQQTYESDGDSNKWTGPINRHARMQDPRDPGSQKFLGNCGNLVHKSNKMVGLNINISQSAFCRSQREYDKKGNI